MSTIVVTGASAGIGLESALQLGADGHHLVLVGRHEVRLADAAEAVRAAGATHVDTFTADFASLDSVRTLGRDLLERFGLAEHVDKHPDRLSGGQQQRAAVVRALCTRPDLLLLDEITAALDPELVRHRDMVLERHVDLPMAF